MKRLNHWEQLLGMTIEDVWNLPARRKLDFLVDCGTALVGFEALDAEDSFGINFYKKGTTFAPEVQLEPKSVVGRTITKIVVPFLEQGYYTDGWITFGFDDGDDIIMASANISDPIRITSID